MKDILAALGIFLSTPAVEAPFGLAWGETKSQLEAKGVPCVHNPDDSGFKPRSLTCLEEIYRTRSFKRITGGLGSCSIKTPPQRVSFGKYYRIVFDSAERLQCAYVSSDYMPNIFSNAAGAKGKAIYARVKSKLIKKYGKPTIVNDDFYCIAPNNCENWGSVWEPAGGGKISVYLEEVDDAFRKVMAQIGAKIPMGSGDLNMLYESPEIVGIDRARENRRKKLEGAADDSGL